MIPLRDANPTRRTPLVTLALIVACFVAFAYELGRLGSGGALWSSLIRGHRGVRRTSCVFRLQCNLAGGNRKVPTFLGSALLVQG